MTKLIALFTLAITFIQGLKGRVQEVTAALADRDSLISDLKGKLDADQQDHADLIARAEAAEKHSAELDATGGEIDAKAAELADAINAHPDTPTVDPATFAVTDPAPAPAASDAPPVAQ